MSGSTTNPHSEIQRRLTSNGQRYTNGRRRLVETLVASNRPVTLPEIVAANPEIASSSAYRNLEVLESSGIIQRLSSVDDHARFELAEPLLEHHHHLICIDCGAMSDVHFDDDLERLVDAKLSEAALEAGFIPLHHNLDLHGRCRDCQ